MDRRNDEELTDMLSLWEGYDNELSPQENLIELQLYMGLMGQSKQLLAQFKLY